MKTAFLNPDLKEDIIMEVPVGVDVDSSKSDMACKLLNLWYGLKQAAQSWNEKLTGVLKNLNLGQCEGDKCIFRGMIDEHEVFVAIFVADSLVASKSRNAQKNVLDAFSESFEMKVGNSSRFIGVQIERDRENKSMFIHQEMYAKKIIEKFGMKDVKTDCVPADPHSLLNPIEDE